MKALIDYFVKEFKSFRHAFRGLGFLAGDHNYYFHFPVGIFILLLGWWFGVSKEEWLWLILGVGLVWITEALNTAIEKAIDLVHPQQHPLAGKVKDIAAAAVLLSVFVSGTIGVIVFYPYFMKFFGL